MKSLSIVLLILFASAAFGKGKINGAISGLVLDGRQFPVSYANVLLLNPLDSSLIKGAVTDTAGRYFFESIDLGSYLVSASMIGYKTVFAGPIAISESQTSFNLPPIQLKDESVELSAIVVRAQKPFIELQNDKLVMNVSSSPVAAGNNALELLSKAPGVIVDNNNQISLRGKQGVLIMIDGKRSYLSMEEVVKMLEGTPASSIESIEIMLNPSAKYDAAGNAGIINIRLKKNKNLGMNGNLTAGIGQGNFPKANGGLRLNYRREKFNLFGNYNYYFNRRFQDLDLRRTIPYEGLLTEFNQFNHQISESNSHNYQAGIDWFPSKKTTVGFLFKGRAGDWDQDARNTTKISGDNPFAFSKVDAGSNGEERWDNYSYNVNLRHQFDDKGRELSFDADYSHFNNSQEMAYFNFFLNSEGEETEIPNFLQSDNFSGVSIKAIKADYTQPIRGKAKLEMGLKSSLVETNNDIEFLTRGEGDWKVDPSRSNQFVYQEEIHAAYLNFNKQFKGFSLQLGLRGEYTISDGNSVTLDQQVQRDYLDFFPSASLSHSIRETHNLSYSYSRRIDRPTYQDLNPFIYFLDQYTFGKGNPFLQAQYTNSFALSYGFKNKFFLTASYSSTKDAMMQVLEQDDATRTTFQTNANLANFNNYSLNFSLPLVVAEWWSVRLNASGFINQFDSPFMETNQINNEQLTYRINVGNNFNLPGDIQAELSGYYQSKLVYGLFEIDPQYTLDMGVSTPVLNGKGKLKFNVNDVFNIRVNKVAVRQDNIDVQVKNKFETRRAYLTFSYNFGNADVKPQRRRRTATSEEQNRVKQN